MIPFEKLESTRTPDGRQAELNRRGEDYFLCVDRAPHYASDSTACQETMAREAFEALKVKRQPRVLLEGFGLGFILAAALRILPPRAYVTIVEEVADIAAWFEGSLTGLHHVALIADERVNVRSQDLFHCLADKDQPGYDAIVLDPDFSLSPALRDTDLKNPHTAIQRLKAGLRSGGRLVIRLENKSSELTRCLRLEGFSLVENLVHPSGREKGRNHTILTATLPYESQHQRSTSR